MHAKNAITATKKKHTAKIWNKFEHQMSLWLASCGAIVVVKAGETD